MLLNQPGYLIRTRFDRKAGVDTYEILDAVAGAKVGFASERTPNLACRVVRSAFGRNLLVTKVAVFEEDTENLVFSLDELPSFWRPHLVLSDASGHKLCSFRGFFASIGGGFIVHDARRALIGHVYCERDEGYYTFERRDGRKIGTIEDQSLSEECSPAEGADGYLVTVANAEDCGKVASILLLAATLALDIVYRDRIGSAPATFQESRG